MLRTVFYAEYLQFKRSTVLWSALLLYLLLGAYSIYYGRYTILHQQEKIAEAADSTSRAQAGYIKNFSADTTTTAGRYNYEKPSVPSLVRFNYYFLAAHEPGGLAALCIGQRDLFPLYYPLNAQSFYVQTLKGDIYNPFKLKAGNFDLAFVIVFLLPLLLGVLCFDTLSAERRAGTDRLLQIAAGDLGRVVMYRVFFRTLVVLSASWVLCLVGFITGRNVPAFVYAGWLIVTLSYAALWAGINYWIGSFRKDGAFNAVAVLSAWVVLTLIVPAGTELITGQASRKPAIRLAALMRSRNMAETDSAMNDALQKFYMAKPDYRPKDTIRSRYFYFQGYSAFLFNGDLTADSLADKCRTLQKKHLQQLALFDPFNPAFNTANLLSALSGTTQEDEWAFKDAARELHRQVYWFSNGPLFGNRLMTPHDYMVQPKFNAPSTQLNARHALTNLFFLVLAATICWSWGWLKLRRYS